MAVFEAIFAGAVLELRQLKYFLGILEHGNFNRAADALFVTQPALSKSMRALEEDLGVELLERTASGVIPTPYGRILANYAALAYQELHRATEEITALSVQGSGRIVVGAGTAILRYILPATFERVSALNPNLEVVIREGLREQLHIQLLRGEIDVALCTRIEGSSSPELIEEVILTDRPTVVAHHSHPLHQKDTVSGKDLSAYRWIVPAISEKAREQLAAMMIADGGSAPKVAVETTSSTLMAQLIGQQPFLSYLPGLLLATDPAYDNIRAIKSNMIWPSHQICIVHRRGSIQLPVIETFLQAVRAAAVQVSAAAADKAAK